MLSDREIIDKLRQSLKNDRFVHTMGVAVTAFNMAIYYGIDAKKAYIAGLLHDCAKGMSEADQLKYAADNGIDLTSCEKDNLKLVHAQIAPHIAENAYGICDSEILNAIRFHTTGMPKMTMLEKIVFIADYIEPGRTVANRLDELRRLAYTDIDMCVRDILYDTLEYLKSINSIIDDKSLSTYNYYEDLINGN